MRMITYIHEGNSLTLELEWSWRIYSLDTAVKYWRSPDKSNKDETYGIQTHNYKMLKH